MKKAVNECEWSFEELSGDILPGYLKTLESAMQTPFEAAGIKPRGLGKAALLKLLNRKSDFSGSYVFIEGNTPIYVGISRSVASRIHQHLKTRTHFSASLAYLIAKRKYNPGSSRTANMHDDKFEVEFEKAQKRLWNSKIATIEIKNPTELYLFEAFAAMAFGTGELNSFLTH